MARAVRLVFTPGGKNQSRSSFRSSDSTMTQNTQESATLVINPKAIELTARLQDVPNRSRLQEVLLEATGNGRSVSLIGNLRRRTSLKEGIKVLMAQTYTYTIPSEALRSLGNDEVFVIGRSGGDIPLDARLKFPMYVDTHVSRIQCFVLRKKNRFLLFDTGINGTKLCAPAR